MLTVQLDSFSCVPTCQIIGTTNRKNQVIGSRNTNNMVPTAIHFESPGMLYPYFYLSWLLQWNSSTRQLDGSLPTVVLIALLNPLGVVSPCKIFVRFTSHLGVYLIQRICWPITADQPAAAAHLTENLNVAFELFQVRTGDGLKPLARNGLAPEGTREAVGIEIRQTIDLCRSEKGRVMRGNAEQLKLKFAKAWEDDDGTARQEMRKVLHKYTWNLSSFQCQ